MKRVKILCLAILMIFLNISSKATHLIGGSFVYEYLDSNGSAQSPYRYKIKIQIIRDCKNSQIPFDYEISIGIYNNDSIKSKYSSININDPTIDKISDSTCSFWSNLCFERAIYQAIVELPHTTKGFHIIHQRCCRNNLNNLISDMGQSYYTFIPPTDKYDNSPYFFEIPRPNICAGDTVNLSYMALDHDGDSLHYSIVTPHRGGSITDTAPIPPVSLNLPLPNVVYGMGYSVSQPLGPGGVATINSSTGLVKILCPNAGFYAFAVEVKSYRNGQLLSSIRRDISLYSYNCPPNNPPKFMGKTSYSINAGRMLSFDISYSDIDSIFITRSGLIFDTSSGQIQPPYPILPETIGSGITSTRFRWNTTCNHISNIPYYFTVYARDNGCPEKVTTNIFQILVKPFIGPDSISGPMVVNEYDTNAMYVAHGLSYNSTIKWQIEGGTINSSDSDSMVIVNWNKAGIGNIRLIETSTYNCGIDTIEYQVTIKMTSGISKQNSVLQNITIYPNPSYEEYFNIKINDFNNIDINNKNPGKIIRVFDSFGNLIYEEEIIILEFQKRIELNNKPKGIYYINIVNEKKSLLKKVVLL